MKKHLLALAAVAMTVTVAQADTLSKVKDSGVTRP